MGTGAITSYVDVAQLVLYAFFAFFAGVIYYLVRENRREGYPLETHRGTSHAGWIAVPEPKTYELADGTVLRIPRPDGGPQEFRAERLQGHEGTPLEPVGDPLLAGVGAGAYAVRPDHPDRDAHGVPKIRPLAVVPDASVNARDPDPRGMEVVDAVGDTVGTVSDLWLDVPEMVFRYLQVRLADGSEKLVPVPFCRITHRGVKVHALLAAQWSGAPRPAAADSITLNEEERIGAYFGGGLLYATPDRQEPLL